ncbi:hypothetical protein [Micromonospora sp. NPDC047730]|uniref:hypothetical protein n=1 Tax=Micromonospora sp. NPDC047730 TaxID=3364253 RepID=UPI00371A4C46
MAKDVKALIRGAKLPETTVSVCLAADLVAQFEQRERELVNARRAAGSSLAGSSKARELAEQIEALRQEMAESTVDFRLRAMPRPEWRAFVAAHPPRKVEGGKVHEDDAHLGVNAETFFDALVQKSTVSPELDAEDWRLLLDEKLTDRQFDELSNAAWALNRREVDVPFSHAASRILRSSGTE